MNGQVFVKLLRNAKYNETEIQFIQQGFTSGFEIWYEGPTNRQQKARNLPLKSGSKTQLWNKMIKEVNLERFAGPFTRIAYDTYIQSPVGLVPKHSEPDQGQGQDQGRGHDQGNHG